MKGLMILVRKEKLDAVKAVLRQRNAGGITVTKVAGCGRQKNSTADLQIVPGADMQRGLLDRMRIDTIVPDADVEPLIDAICDAAQTGNTGDGKIFVYDVQDAIRIRTRERGDAAL